MLSTFIERMNNIDVSIIVPTFKRLDILKETYQALQAACEGLRSQIIIVNDDSEALSASVYSYIGGNSTNTIVINNLKKGAASARNTGAGIAQSSLLLFVDDDMVLNKPTIEGIILLHKKYDKILSTPLWEYSPKMLSDLNNTPFGRYRIKYDYTAIKGSAGQEFMNEPKIFKVESLATFCLSIKKEHYQLLGGLDETFPFAGCEDQDFTMRAKLNGFSLLIDENHTIFHNELDRTEKKTWLIRQHNGVQGFVLLCQKYPERKLTPLWRENTPIAKQDNFSLKIKKGEKAIMRQNWAIESFSLLVKLAEKMSLPDDFLGKLYNVQAGIYINKGFHYSFNNAHRSHNG